MGTCDFAEDLFQSLGDCDWFHENTARERIIPVIERLHEDGWDRDEIEELLSRVVYAVKNEYGA
jgi:hypothetical protein